MTEIRYTDLAQSPTVQSVQTMGSQAGPPGGDGWTQLAALPTTNMIAGARSYAILVRGKVGNYQILGATPVAGCVQVCLGTTGGTKHTHFRMASPLNDNVPAGEGVPFEFLVLIDPTFTDPLFGSTINPATTELCLWARAAWNGDQQNYAATFDVTDVHWQWWDLTAIPAGHWAADRDTTVLQPPLTAPATFTRLAAAAAGNNTEQWLHFGNVWYEPRAGNMPAPVFRIGVTPDSTEASFITKIGNGGRWGCRRWPGVGVMQEVPQVQQGAFWLHTHTNSATKAAYFAHGGTGSVGNWRLFRWTWFAVRIDTLIDRLQRTETVAALGRSVLHPTWPLDNLKIERPEPEPGILTHPIVMLHGVIKHNGPRTGYGAFLMENEGGVQQGEGACWTQTNPTLLEGQSSIGVGRRVFQTTSPAMQWWAMFVGAPLTAPIGLQECFDFCFVQFHPVRDPENITDPPGPRPPPLVLIPGFQSASVANLNAPPAPPEATILALGQTNRVGIDGKPYRRRWPLSGRPSQLYRMVWPALPATDADALFEFLRANPAWKFTPPYEAAVAVLNNSRPQMQVAGGNPGLYSVSVEVVTLRFTGP